VQFDGADCHFLGLQILRGQESPVAARPTESRPMGSLVTSCFLLDRSRVNGATFDESLFIQYEDHDFGVRLRALGGDLLSVPEALCYHGRGTVGLSIRQLGGYSRVRVLGLIRNRWALILKTWSVRTLFLLTPVLAAYELAQLVVVIKRGWLREWLRAVWWTLTHSRELLEKRRRVQCAKEVPDRQLLQDGPLPFRPEFASDRLERAGQRALNSLATAYWRLVAPLV
jgi:GT2 family glycosyltransferase